MGDIEYHVEDRQIAWAVIRTGPRGGERLIAVYTKQWVADHAVATLNSYVNDEA